MGERWKHWLLPWYNRQAGQITDPVQRLRYLRSVSRAKPDQILTPVLVPWTRIGTAVRAAAISDANDYSAQMQDNDIFLQASLLNGC